jgi:hypothetical protein
MAFLCSFSALISAALIWMGLFLWLLESSDGRLNVAAQLISPEGALGWVLYVALSIAIFVPLARKYVWRRHD